MNDLAALKGGMIEATEGFKKMQYALLAFAAISALGLLVAAIAIFKNS